MLSVLRRIITKSLGEWMDKRSYRVVCTGGRNYQNSETVNRVMRGLQSQAKAEGKTLMVASGGAAGADALVLLWCLRNEVSHRTYSAEWSMHGRAAGPIRNKKMLEVFEPHIVVAFPGGRGTENCISQADIMDIPVHMMEDE